MVGADLATRWQCEFLDSDEVYEQQTGVAVSAAVVDDELAFRDWEQVVVQECLQQPGTVVAVGSGAVDSPVVQEALRTCPVVWLQVGPAELARRSGLSGPRPVRLGNVHAMVQTMLAARAATYEAIADLTVLTDGRGINEIVDEISSWEESHASDH